MTASTSTNPPATVFMILARAAPSKGGWSGYRKVAVVEVDPAALPEGRTEPHAIDARARGVVRIVQVWERVHEGRTARSEYGQAMLAAEQLVAELQAKRERDAAKRQVAARRDAACQRYEAGDEHAVVLADALRQVGRVKTDSVPSRWSAREKQALVEGLALMDAFAA